MLVFLAMVAKHGHFIAIRTLHTQIDAHLIYPLIGELVPQSNILGVCLHAMRVLCDLALWVSSSEQQPSQLTILDLYCSLHQTNGAKED